MTRSLHFLAEHSPSVVLRYRRDGTLLYASPATHALLGHDPAALVGTSVRSLVHDDDGGRLAELEALSLTGADAEGSLRWRRFDGDHRSLEVAVFVDGEDDFLVVGADASEREAVERSVRDAESRLAKIAENVPGMLYQCLTRPEGKAEYLFASSWAEKVLGIPRAELYASVEALHSRIHPDDRESYQRSAKAARSVDRPWIWTGRMLDQNGDALYVVTHAVPERQPDGAVIWSGAMLDATEARRAQGALVDAEERFRAVIDNMDVGFLRSSVDGVIVMANPAAARMFGYDDVDDLVGRQTQTAIWTGAAARAALVGEIEKHGASTLNIPARRKDGKPMSVEARVRAVRSGEGVICGYDNILRDTTDARRSQEMIERAREAAEAATIAKTSFLANMSHEIRTPMNAIVGLTRLALDAAPPPKIREYLTHVETASRTLLALLNDVLDVSKIEAGKLQLEARPFDLDAVLDDVVTVALGRAAEKKLELCVSVDPAVPATLVGDSMRLGQVLSNLLSNAIKFTNAGDILVSVVVDCIFADQVRLRFLVRDHGIGISEEALAKLFQPFVQADSSMTRRYGGTGLGLVLCRQIVEQMGGRLEVESTPGVGSTFGFWVDLGLAPTAEGRRRALWPALDLRGTRALVVDDNVVSRSVLAGSLRAMAFVVSTASSGAQALGMLRVADKSGEPFRLVLLDGLMPEMSGAQTAEYLAADMMITSKPSVIMVSAYEANDSARAPSAAIAAHLRKPVSRSTLLDAILAVFNLKQPDDPVPSRRRQMPDGRPLDAVRVLAVEDHDVNQFILREILEHLGANVVLASDGEEALTVAKQRAGTYDVVLMDVQMPRMDGYETTRRLRTEPWGSRVPIIALTAHAFEEERLRCLAAGMNDHVPKPIDPERLVQTILRWLPNGESLRPEPGPVTQPSAADFDESELTAIFGDEPDRKSSFMRRLVDSCRAGLVSAADAIEARDAVALTALGHKLKAAPHNVGAHALGSAMDGIEAAAKIGDFGAASIYCHEAAAAIEALEHWLADRR